MLLFADLKYDLTKLRKIESIKMSLHDWLGSNALYSLPKVIKVLIMFHKLMIHYHRVTIIESKDIENLSMLFS